MQLRSAFNRVLLITASTIAFLFLCAAAVEWIRGAYMPFRGLVNYEWVHRLQAFLYLMAMFNVLLIRYVVMRIYTAPGTDGFEKIVGRLYNADASSMVICGLPCIYGLVLFLLRGDVIDFYLLFGLSIIYGMIYFPRYKKWVSIAEQNFEAGTGVINN